MRNLNCFYQIYMQLKNRIACRIFFINFLLLKKQIKNINNFFYQKKIYTGLEDASDLKPLNIVLGFFSKFSKLFDFRKKTSFLIQFFFTITFNYLMSIIFLCFCQQLWISKLRSSQKPGFVCAILTFKNRLFFKKFWYPKCMLWLVKKVYISNIVYGKQQAWEILFLPKEMRWILSGEVVSDK